jgi:hypothetical protein
MGSGIRNLLVAYICTATLKNATPRLLNCQDRSRPRQSLAARPLPRNYSGTTATPSIRISIPSRVVPLTVTVVATGRSEKPAK